MYLVLLVIHVLVTLALIGIILVQRSAADGLGSMGGGGGGGAGFMTGRAQANLLTRTTAILATIFILNSLALSWLTQQDVRDRSYADQVVEQEAAPLSAPLPSDTDIVIPKVSEEVTDMPNGEAPLTPAEVPTPE